MYIDKVRDILLIDKMIESIVDFMDSEHHYISGLFPRWSMVCQIEETILWMGQLLLTS